MQLSIIIPTLNEECYIGSLLSCLTRQNDRDFEVLVVDADSKDDTKAVVSKFKGTLNLRFITTKKRSIAFQRNLGASKALYPRLLFLDSDVKFDNNFIKNSLREIRLKKAMTAIVHYVPDDKRWYYRLFFNILNSWFFLFHRIYGSGCGACIFTTRNIHDKIGGFSESVFWANDSLYLRDCRRQSNEKMLKTRVIVSVRRFESEGTKKTMYKWIRSYFLIMFNRPAKTNKIEYKYGNYVDGS